MGISQDNCYNCYYNRGEQMDKGLNDDQINELFEYCQKALLKLGLSDKEYSFALNNYEDRVYRKEYDLKVIVPFGSQHPGYYGYYNERKKIMIDADDYLKNLSNDSVWKIKVLHEIRHAYQHKQVELYDQKYNPNEDKSVIMTWKNDFEIKKTSTSDSRNPTERDAIIYSERNWDKV